MPLLWCSISGHGFGHAGQVVPVLNALGECVPNLRVILRTTVPTSFFHARLTIPWELRPAQQDVGCVQNGPLTIDVPATWKALEAFHRNWDTRVLAEATEMQQARPSLVLSDISYLALDAAARAAVPAVALASLAWDEIMVDYVELERAEQLALIADMQSIYRRAELVIRISPGMPLRAFRKALDVGPMTSAVDPQRALLRKRLGAGPEDRVVLVGFGGVSLNTLPFDRMEEMQGYRFVVDSAPPCASTRIHAAASLGLPFLTLLASVDIIMTKPGYSTIVEAVDKGRPVVYVRRYNFGDEQGIVEYLHRHGRGVELAQDDFSAGAWHSALAQAWETPAPPLPPPKPGTADAARICARYLTTTAR